MLIQNGYLQITKFTTVQRTSQSGFPILDTYMPEAAPRQEGTSHICSSKNNVFLLNCYELVHGVEIKAQKQTGVPELISEPRTHSAYRVIKKAKEFQYSSGGQLAYCALVLEQLVCTAQKMMLLWEKKK